jgi:hypothetical protein
MSGSGKRIVAVYSPMAKIDGERAAALFPAHDS